MPVFTRHGLRVGLAAAALSASLLLAACQPASTPARTLPPPDPTAQIEINQGYPADEPEESYPASEADQTIAGLPTPTGSANPEKPAGAPARENSSKITAQVISIVPDAENADFTILHVKILATQAVEGMPSFTQDKVNQEIDLYMEQPVPAELKAGSTIDATVLYLGDERGGKYHISKIDSIKQ